MADLSEFFRGARVARYTHSYQSMRLNTAVKTLGRDLWKTVSSIVERKTP